MAPVRTENIRDEIVAQRKQRVAALGFDEGVALPAKREVPLTPFLGKNGLICEVKRRSPSKGDIAPGLDAVAQATLYTDAGAGNLSVLTVPEGFGGSLRDLHEVKKAHPAAAVLRKDFLFDERDIDTAFRAGADAVLLIAGMLTAETLEAMHARAKSLGMEALVEVHDAEDVAKAARFRPTLVGINSRDLTTFRVDPMLPLRVRAGLSWPCRVVYESGIQSAGQASFAASAGFDGILVGEGVVRRPALAGELLAALSGAKPSRFWRTLAEKQYALSSGKNGALAGGRWRPLAKICGLAREEDARLAAELGADILGFVFYEKSPRRADPALLRKLRDVKTLKTGVVVTGAGREIPAEVKNLLADGLLDALQLHGDETPEEVEAAAANGAAYKALRPRDVSALAAADAYRCPRILLDASAPVPGGSGTRVDGDILCAWKNRPLWLAGGITPDNVAGIAEMWRPELIDLASGVEDRPGVKSTELLKHFFSEI